MKLTVEQLERYKTIIRLNGDGDPFTPKDMAKKLTDELNASMTAIGMAVADLAIASITPDTSEPPTPAFTNAQKPSEAALNGAIAAIKSVNLLNDYQLEKVTKMLRASLLRASLSPSRDAGKLVEEAVCTRCGKITNNLHGNPGLWRVDLHYNGNGRNQPYHQGCVSEMLRASAAADRDGERYRWLRDAHDCDWNKLMRDGGEQMDANIDAAMLASAGGDGGK